MTTIIKGTALTQFTIGAPLFLTDPDYGCHFVMTFVYSPNADERSHCVRLIPALAYTPDWSC